MIRIIGVIVIILAGVLGLYLLSPDGMKDPTSVDKKEPIDLITKDVKRGFITCEICGYDALDSLGSKCKVCFNSINDSTIAAAEVATRKDLIIISQLEFFKPIQADETIEFLIPTVSKDGYPKNPKWRPSVFESQVFEYYKLTDSLNKHFEANAFNKKLETQ